MKSALVLCSGGLDSVVCAHYIRKKLKYDNITLVFFNYGQNALFAEKNFSKNAAREINARFLEIKIPFYKDIINKPNIKLVNHKVSLPDLKDSKDESNKWYFPARNILFLTYTLAFAESILIKEKKYLDIFLGLKCEGKDSFPDATLNFLKDINKISKSSTVGKFDIIAPFIKKDKEDIIQMGKKLNVNFKKTFSCYVSKKIHCGHCLACRLRQEGFYWANLPDPTVYAMKMKDSR